MGLVAINRMVYPHRYAVASAGRSFDAGLNAANEGVFAVGTIVIPGGGSKTFSSAGGKLGWATFAVSNIFADAGTTLRVGVQGASSDLPSGVWAVYADLVGGTDTIANNTSYETAMEAGSTTITDGDSIAMVVQLQSRGGSDQIIVSALTGGYRPAGVTSGIDTGAGWVRTLNYRYGFYLIFDDGTIGYFKNFSYVDVLAEAAFSSSSAGGDEYGNHFVVPFKIRASGIWVVQETTSPFELCLYRDALSASPTLLEAISLTSPLSTDSERFAEFSATHYLEPNIDYAVTVRPTTTGSFWLAYTSGYKAGLPVEIDDFAADVYAVRRLDNSGAFSSWYATQPNVRRMQIGILIDGVFVETGSANFNMGI